MTQNFQMQPNSFYCPVSHNSSQGVMGASPFSHMNSLYSSSTMFSGSPITPVSTALYGTTMSATPVSSVLQGTGTNSTTSWAHTIPTFMPWVPKDKEHAVEPVMRFTAPFPPDPCTSQTATSWELLNNLSSNINSNANLHLKRHSDTEEIEVSPQKQYITEEKMAARMKELHISNQYTVPQENSPFGPYGDSSEKLQKPIKSLQELEAMLSENFSDKNMPYKGSVILAPEIKALVESEKIFAKTIIEEIQRPTMAVVLWQPPHGSMKDIPRCLNEEDEKSSRDRDENFVLSDDRLSEANNNAYTPTSVINSGPQQFILPRAPPSVSSNLAISSGEDDADVNMDM